ncbi:M16 family metallopeptidase [Paracoccus sp. p4-l81]|uniref:M16 family metallopeptidase n=1 Tax=Paracoccus sp. p4-l81 TaxID=3342806 RepID=UPI0035BA3A04
MTQITTLPNGLRIVTQNMAGLASASIGIWVGAGGRHETAAQNGIAHFLEHMAFKGTPTRSALQIAEAIEDVGGHINAYTSREVTAYYARVLAGDVPLALEVLADILLNPLFEDREIEIERGVILQEIGQSLDTPDDVVFDWLQEAAFPDQAMGRTILGPAERVQAFGRADLAGFVADHYGPGNLIVAAAGAVDHDRIVRQAEALFSHLTPRPATTVQPAIWQGQEKRVSKRLEQAHWALAFQGPGYKDADFYAAQVWSMVLGGGMSSRLFQKVREEKGLCYSIFAQSGFYQDAGMTTIYAGTSGADLPELTHLTIDEMKRAADDLTEAEVARARAQLKAGLLMGLESPSAQAERLARVLAIWDRIPTLDEVAARIDGVTAQSVRDHGARMLTAARPALALYGPVGKAPGLDRIAQRLAA